MKIIHFIEAMNDFGGTPRKLLYFSEHLNTRMHECIFVVYLNDSPFTQELEKNGCRIINLATANPILLFYRFVRLLRDLNPDVVCTHFVRPLVLGALAAKLCGIPVVHNEHSSAYWRKGFSGRLSRLCLPMAGKVICNSRFTANSIQNTFNVSEQNIAVVYNPVIVRKRNEQGLMLREHCCIGENTVVVTHVGGMIAIRDQKTLISGFFIFQQHVPDSVLVMVGDGPERASLERLVAELGLTDKVHFLGYCDAIGDVLEASDIYVNTTLEEGFGIAVVEAMLHGLPVVLSRCGAHPELIEDGGSGVFFEGGNSQDLAHVLMRLNRSPEQRKAMGEQALARAMSLYRPANYVEGVVSILENVVANHAG